MFGSKKKQPVKATEAETGATETGVAESAATVSEKVVASDRYLSHDEAVVISCYFNPKKSEYRKNLFLKFYDTIKHVNHRIIECAIGEDSFDLPEDPFIKRVRTQNLLWHKEGLLNIIIKELPPQFQFIFWIDGDILFKNQNWIVDGVAKLSTGYSIVQPFEYCIHLEKDEIEPTSLNLEEAKALCNTAEATIPRAERRVWRSFAANYETNKVLRESQDYDVHGHVGFAWGSTRELLTSEGVSGLYDKALCGGADHIMAHACVGQIPHCCITKAYVDTIDLKAITSWSKRFYFALKGN